MALSPEKYLLQCLSEEISEVQKEISKCLRFTPDHRLNCTSNLERLNAEYSEVITVISVLLKIGVSIEAGGAPDLLYADSKNNQYLEYIKKENGVPLTKQEYLLQCLTRELASMQKCTSDCMLLTPEHRHKSASNLERLSIAYSEVTAIISLLQDEGLNIEFSGSAMTVKLERLDQFMEISREMGTLVDIVKEC